MTHPDTDTLPFVAPCRRLDLRAPLAWLQLGWRDFRNSEGRSAAFGIAMVLVSWMVSGLAWYFGNLGLLLGMMSGFVLLGPLLAITVYSLSDQLQRGEPPRFRRSVRAVAATVGSAAVFMVVLTIVFLVWARAASMVHVFFPSEGATAARDLWIFLGVGTSVGAVFAAIVFLASAVSLPMLLDKQADAITCVLTSVNAVLRNKPVMFFWAALIVAGVLLGTLTLFVGFVVILPVIGHASWHAYRDCIDASQWPPRDRPPA
ncbi:MAG: DUF2189 domain-containing protein [Gammaproteobacteria bacterium]|nr:DUF2189 domain-containing protein [Gammaproteobacteria bacterium]